MDPTIINPEALKRLEEWGGTDLVTQMVRLFIQNSPERVEQIRSVFGDDPGSVPERGSHSLKSSAANVGAERVREVATKIEHAASQGDLEQVRTLVPELEGVYEEAIQALESILQGTTE
jgi:HPt (histidine-containing phosphotransfer) domain-containing protein